MSEDISDSFYVINNDPENNEPENMGTPDPIMLVVVIGIIGVVALVIVLKRRGSL